MVKSFFISILFLGVIPCDTAVFTWFKNPEMGELIARMLNFVTCGYSGIYFAKGLARKVSYKSITDKYLIYFVTIILLNIIGSLLSAESAPILTRTMSIICLCAYYLLALYAFGDVRSLIKTLNATLFVLIVMSVVLYYTDYENATYIENATTRYFKGVAANRNSYSEISLFYILSNIYLWSTSRKHSVYYIITTIVAIYTTNLTHSATSIISMMFMILLLIWYIITNKTIPFKMFLFVYIVIFISLIVIQSSNTPFLSEILEYFQKDSNLTGRTDIWRLSWRLVAQQPIFGNGFDTEALLNLGVLENDPHNSILYMLLTQGLLGLIIFLTIFLKTITNAKVNLKNEPLFSFMYIFIMIWMIRGLTESIFSYTHFVFWLSIIIIEMLLVDKKTELLNGEIHEE